MMKSGIRSTEADTCEQYYSIKTVAKMFEISESTLRRVLRDRGIQVVRIGGSVRISNSDIENLFEVVPSIKDLTNTILNE